MLSASERNLLTFFSTSKAPTVSGCPVRLATVASSCVDCDGFGP